ncbi:MAG: hypothetical protein Q8N77_02435, partial [Nanoarchaeota archaeon]|nr:hypothetical protein [Nanoarchaeota archaeon]
IGGDKEKLAEYVNIWFDKTGKEKSMGVYLRSNTSQNELRALVLYYDNSFSIVTGNGDLLNVVRFLSGAKQK